jgi:hypothetical protein
MCSNCNKVLATKESKENCISHTVCKKCVVDIYKDEFSEEDLKELVTSAKY